MTLPLYQFVPYAFAALLVVSTGLFWLQARRYKKRFCASKELGEKFINTVPHQVRAPLSAIKGYSSLLLEGDYGPISPELRDVLKGMHISSNNLVDIVGDYIDLANLAFDNIRYAHESFDAKEIIEDLIHLFRENPLTVTLDLRESGHGPYIIMGDRAKIAGALRRLIENAVKYTPKGSITISLQKSADKILISVEDTGIGIAQADIQTIFEEFHRATNARNISAVGTGLGLYLSKQVIQAHGGHIWAESEGVSKGARFFVELPSLE